MNLVLRNLVDCAFVTRDMRVAFARAPCMIDRARFANADAPTSQLATVGFQTTALVKQLVSTKRSHFSRI